MNAVSSSHVHILSISFAIFSMLFGAGNLMYPLMVGMSSGSSTIIGFLGFFLTAVCLPVCGLIAMIMYDGNYYTFFHRLGKKTGDWAIFICMLIIGPLIAIPRIVTVSHLMIAPFLPSFFATIHPASSFLFALIFLGITFCATYNENRIVDVLGYYVGPTLLASLIVIIVYGFFTAEKLIISPHTSSKIFIENFIRGYETLDLLAVLFFSSITLSLIKMRYGKQLSHTKLALIGLQSGCIGVGLLALVYSGMAFLGAYHAHGLELLNGGQLFSALSLRILGQHGAIVISIAVLMACFSTVIALIAVIAQYIQALPRYNKITFFHALVLAIAACLPLSSGLLNMLIPAHAAHSGDALDLILLLAGGPILYIGYPMLITLTLCNIGYKLCNFTPVRIPVYLTGSIATACYFYL